VGGSYVGVYWTLPVNWAGFRDLPPDVDAAAAASRTILYQRERVRGWVRDQGGSLLGELAFMDTRTDRATDAVRDALRRAAPAYAGTGATLLAVQFHEAHHWRRNPFLHEAAAELGLQVIGLSPDPITIGGQRFDPARHFAQWRTADGAATARLRLGAHEGLRAALAEVPAGDGRWHAMADLLNGRGIRTVQGGTWTAENVRKLVSRLDLLQGQT
jgi:hypothetical protein